MTPSITYRWAMDALHLTIERGTPEILCYGARGVSKTLCLCNWLLNLATIYPGMTQIWARSTRTRLSDGAIKTLEDEVLPLWGISLGAKDRGSRSSYELPNGSEIILQGLDDPDRQKSVRADIVWVNEPSEITEAQWEEVGGSLRSSLNSRCPFRLLIGDHNPMPAAHWTYTRCAPVPSRLYPRVLDDGTRMAEWLPPSLYQDIQDYNAAPLTKPALTKKIIFCAADNPGYWSLDPWGWTPAGLEYARSRLGRMTGSRKARYLEGRPVAEEGTVFGDSFGSESHVVESHGVGDWPVIVGYDPGYDHPCAVLFVAIAPDGQPLVIEEIYGSGIGLGSLAERIKTKVATNRWRVTDYLADPFGAFAQTQAASGRSIAETMAGDHGIEFRRWPAARGADKVAQVEAVRTWLCADQPLQIFRQCINTIGEFESWSYARLKDGTLPSGDDRFEDKNNHAMDVLMGILATRPNADKPVARLLRKA